LKERRVTKGLKEEVRAGLEAPKSKGATQNKRCTKWKVICQIDGKRKHLGYFDDHVGAVEVRSSYKSQQTIDNSQ
jgi:hypothetical protein